MFASLCVFTPMWQLNWTGSAKDPEMDNLFRVLIRKASRCRLLLLICATSPASGQTPLHLQLGFQGVPDRVLPIIAHRTDIAPHVGKSYDLSVLRFNASTDEISALATGEIQLATFGFSSFGIAIENAHMDDIRAVADIYRDGVEGYYSNEFMVRNDSPIQKIEDLKGKVLGANGGGSVVDIAIRYVLKQRGLAANRDYTLLDAPLPSLVPMLLDRKLDLATVGIAYKFEPRVQKETRVLFTERDALGVTQFAFVGARESFLARNHERLDDFFDDFVRVTRWMRDPAHRDEAIRIVSEFTKQPQELLGAYYMTKQDDYRDPDARPDIAALQRNLDAMQELGFLKSHVDAAKHSDLSFIDSAVRRLHQ
jgi:sulfonate transport system substrate-binding protein